MINSHLFRQNRWQRILDNIQKQHYSKKVDAITAKFNRVDPDDFVAECDEVFCSETDYCDIPSARAKTLIKGTVFDICRKLTDDVGPPVPSVQGS